MEENCNLEILSDHHLSLKLDNFYGRYGCMAIFEDDQSKNELRYKIDIKYLGKQSEFTYAYRIERDPKIYINDKVSNNLMDELAAKVSQVIYPLDVLTSHDGSLKSILNFEEVCKRWPMVKEEIRKYYKGATVEKYLQLNDNTLSSYDQFYKKMSQDWFLQLYFSSLYISYSEDLYVFKKVYYSIAGNAGPVQYEATQKLEGTKTNDTSLFVKIKGEIKDERCALDLEQELDFPYYREIYPDEKDLKGTCNVTYSLNKETGIVEGLEAEFDTKFSEPKKVMIKMYLLDTLADDDAIENNEKNENGFWSRFFKKSNK